MPLTPGSRLGRYVIVRQLGAGAMGEVYLAEDPHIERRVAIKTIRVDAQEHLDEAARSRLSLRFEREAKVAGRLVHPHIVTLFDAGDVDGLFFLAFEFVDGSDLAARSRQQPSLTLREILRLGREAASALDAAHRVGIIHRDIKPANLLLNSEGLLKIADFGIATLMGQGAHLTQTGSLIGTPQYLSPEQVKSDAPLDGRSDLFSMGVVLYELLAGRRPLEGATLPALLYAVVLSEPVSLRDLRPDLPARLTAAVMRLLAKERDDRFPTAAALGEELAAIERELAGTSGATRVSETQPDQAPTVVAGFTSPTKAATTPPEVIPPTLHHAPLEGGGEIPPTRQLGAPVAVRRTSRAPVVVVAAVVAVLAAGFAAMQWLPSPKAEPEVKTPVGRSAPETARGPDVTSPVPPPGPATATQTTTTSEPPAPAGYIVGGVVTFQVAPADAAERAVVKIDGLVRGLAAGSMMTLRPGMHVIEITAEGFEPKRLNVESRADAAAPSELSVTLVRR